ncbi:hypothetical protein SCLCIDRAFT_138886 [Scleroderma citrinum Foug A]|uniref:Uncharacterized protein n=1 Tax=Scleroderma citrinum Foug A TaxID=1036808 RepID=A0A0C3DAZ4_9AGAM|nr:hypothetical protein SCLCIDRAFT_138886 [Scleroderma citrinum Foug A]
MKRCTQITLDPLHHCFPPQLITLATIPLPTSHLFHEASQSADALDELDLHHWDAGPPFLQPEPADTMQEAQFTKNLTHIFLSQKVHLENQAKACRACKYRSGAGSEIVTELHAIITQVFSKWDQLKDSMARCTTRSHKEMTETLLQWHARIIYLYYHEAGILEQGGDPY